jgi:hypothetical protein
MDIQLGVLIVLLQGLAGSILLSRLYGTELGKHGVLLAQSSLSTLLPTDTPASCGLLSWSDYTVLSSRVVLEGKRIAPAAGVCAHQAATLSFFSVYPSSEQHQRIIHSHFSQCNHPASSISVSYTFNFLSESIQQAASAYHGICVPMPDLGR